MHYESKRGQLLITHYQRLLDHVTPVIHVLVDGRIVASGGMELAAQLERWLPVDNRLGGSHE